MTPKGRSSAAYPALRALDLPTARFLIAPDIWTTDSLPDI
jgi:hypothetical protein